MARIRVHEWIFQESQSRKINRRGKAGRRARARTRSRFILAENKRNKRNVCEGAAAGLPGERARSLAVPRGLALADREFSRQKVFTGVGQGKAVKRHSKLPMRQFAYLSSSLSKALELDGGRERVGVGWQARRVLRFANRKIQLSTWLRRVPTTISIFGLCLYVLRGHRVKLTHVASRVSIDHLCSQSCEYNKNVDKYSIL